MKEDMTDWMRAIYLGQYSFRSLEEAFRSAWDAGAAAEREACAKVCDEQVASGCLAPLEVYRADFIAAAIRARGKG
jgi:hypothetical protein